MTHREIWLSRNARNILAAHRTPADVLVRIKRSSAALLVSASLPMRGRDGGLYGEILQLSGYRLLTLVVWRGVTIIQLDR